MTSFSGAIWQFFLSFQKTNMGLDSIVPSVLNFLSSLSSPIQILLLVAVVFIVRKVLKAKFDRPIEEEPERPLEPFKKRDFTIDELKEYDGIKSPYVLMAVNGKVFDVTRGKDFYGPGIVIVGFLSETFSISLFLLVLFLHEITCICNVLSTCLQ